MSIGKNLKYVCKLKGITLKDLSNETGLAYSTITNIVSRDPESISYTTMDKLCKALGVDSISLEAGDILGYYSFEERQKKEIIDSIKKYGMSTLISIPGYSLTFENGIMKLITPKKKIPINDDELEELEKLCSHMVKYELDQFIEKKTTENK